MWIQESYQSSQQKLGIEMPLSEKDLWRTLLSDDLDLQELPEKPTKFCFFVFFFNSRIETLPVCTKEAELDKMNEGYWTLGVYWYEMSLKNQTVTNRCYLLRKGKNGPKGKLESSEPITAAMGMGGGTSQ